MSADARVEAACDIDEATLTSVADRILEALDLADAELSVLLTTDAHIAELNAKWRDKEGATDVLSFPQEEIPGGAEGPRLLGDVVVALETARAQASEHGHSLLAELRVLLTHGVLHLLGYDHETDEQRVEMTRAEDRILARIGDEPRPGLVGRSDQG